MGGGIAGCIAAISLAPHYKVILVDKRITPNDRIGESLAPAANRILSALDLLQPMEQAFPPIFKQNLGMQSFWGSDQLHIVDHLSNPDGFVKSLDRKAFEIFLRTTAEKRGVTCVWGTVLTGNSWDQENNRWNIELRHLDENNGPNFIQSQFVIDATGRQSHFARSLGIQREAIDKLIACWISLPNNIENTMSTIASSPDGWWYSAVLPNNKRIIAFQTDSDIFPKSTFKTTENFLELISKNEYMNGFLKDTSDSIEFHGTTAANSSKLQQVAGKNWAAIGDAAVSFDPLSSQGMFNAMANAMQLRDLILTHGLSPNVAQNYQQQVSQIWTHYLHHRTLFYQAERRWNKLFWSRRS